MDRNDLGFGSVVARQSRERLLNRDGSFNVRREGLGFLQSMSAYHWLLGLTWPRFLATMGGVFLAVNLLFAAAYDLCGAEALTGIAARDGSGRFLGDFFFSVQTFATIGYGSISPARTIANVLVVLEAASGLLLVALGTGITFARFARPRAKVLFSDARWWGPTGAQRLHVPARQRPPQRAHGSAGEGAAGATQGERRPGVPAARPRTRQRALLPVELDRRPSDR